MTEKKPETLIPRIEMPEYLKKKFNLSFAQITIDKWRDRGVGPNYIRIEGTKIFYKESDVLKWRLELEQQTNVKPKGKKNGSSKRQRAARK